VNRLRTSISYLFSAALSAGLAACTLPPVQSNGYSIPPAQQSATAQPPAKLQPSCVVDAVKICQDNARERPPLFFPDAIKGQSAANPSNLMAFAAPLQIPGGPQLKVACYYRPGSMAVVYARAWVLVGGNQLVDLNPQPGQVLNSPDAPTAPPLDPRDYQFLHERGYCLSQ
jgi:hypothetical protein